MNKVCRTIYNKALGAFVAVSEHDKAPRKAGEKTTRAIVGLAAVIGLGTASPLAFAQFAHDGGSATGTNSIAIGTGSSAANGDSGLAVGINANADGNSATAVGAGSSAA